MTRYLTDEDLAELERLAHSADVLPWEKCGTSGIASESSIVLTLALTYGDKRGADADFIVASCNSIEPLVGEVRRLRLALMDVLEPVRAVTRDMEPGSNVNAAFFADARNVIELMRDTARAALSPPKEPA